MNAKAVRQMSGETPSEPVAGALLSLRLYVAGSTPNSERAVANLQSALQKGDNAKRFAIEIIDVLTSGVRVIEDNVIVTPTLVALGSKRRRVIVGDLADDAILGTFLQDAGG